MIPATATVPVVLTVNEICAIARISRRTWTRLHLAGLTPPSAPFHRRRYLAEDVSAWLHGRIVTRPRRVA